MAETTKIQCSRCGNDLSEEETECPRMEGDDPICDECYHDKYEFTCCCCCEHDHIDHQHKMVVVFEELPSMGGPTRGIAPGVYRVTGHPYHGGYMIGQGWLYGECLQRIADVNPDMDGEGYPCGHLCAECQKKVEAQKEGTCADCGQVSASCALVKMGSWKDFKARQYQWTAPKIVCAGCRHKHRGAWELVSKGGD